MEAHTSRVRLIAAPLSRILNTSPVLRRTWKDKERFKRWSKASWDIAEAKIRRTTILGTNAMRTSIGVLHHRSPKSLVETWG